VVEVTDDVDNAAAVGAVARLPLTLGTRHGRNYMSPLTTTHAVTAWLLSRPYNGYPMWVFPGAAPGLTGATRSTSGLPYCSRTARKDTRRQKDPGPASWRSNFSATGMTDQTDRVRRESDSGVVTWAVRKR